MKSIKTLFLIAIAFIISGTISLEAKGTKEQAQAMVKKAIAYYKANGQEKTFKEINNKTGMFLQDDLYVMVYNMSGVCLAHGFIIKQVGKNTSTSKDLDGKFYIKERLNIAQTQGSGWQDYKFMNPTTYKVENKTVYIEKVDNLIFTCGAYK
jgi:signal transduction histidine kinase